MSITPLEYVKKEFNSPDRLSTEDWLRKMQEFSVLQNSKIDLSHIIEMSDKSKLKGLNVAVSALYFSDNFDYKNSLLSIVRELSNIEYDVLDEKVIRDIFYLLNQGIFISILLFPAL